MLFLILKVILLLFFGLILFCLFAAIRVSGLCSREEEQEQAGRSYLEKMERRKSMGNKTNQA